MDFIKQHLELIIGIVFFAVFVFQAVRMLKKAKKIDSEGIETTAVVTRIEDVSEPGITSPSYTTYVSFHDQHGEEHECPMSLTPELTHRKGDEVRIRYIPGDWELVREIKDARDPFKAE